jgi:hypothetical protein
MRVLVACEFSGIVRDAFRARGHDAWSCDVIDGEGQALGDWRPDLYPPGHQLAGHRFHYKCDVRDILSGCVAHTMQLEGQGIEWDLMIAHPPCTHLSVSGARWFSGKRDEQAHALGFVMQLANAPIPRICIENPISIISSHWREPDQIIHPHNFGHPEFKATCLWLKGLPPLRPTNQLQTPDRNSAEWKRWNKVHRASPSDDRWKERSRTYSGVAAAMASQWGDYTDLVTKMETAA